MNDTNMNNPEPTREDVIIGRIVDGEASPNDWHDLDRISEKDAAVWQRLAQAQRAHARLERAVEDEIAVAELVNLPLHQHHAVHDFMTRLRVYGGWAVAAVLALALVGVPMARGPQQNMASFIPLDQATADQAYDQYVKAGMKEGRVVGEWPSALLDAKDIGEESGGEIMIIRRVVERVNVKDMPFYTVESNEFGQPALRKVEVQAEKSKTSETKGVGF